MLIDAFAVDGVARFSIGVSTFETQGMDPGLHTALTLFLRQAFATASTTRDFNIPFYPRSKITHAGVAASSNGAFVALRMQLGSNYYSKVGYCGVESLSLRQSPGQSRQPCLGGAGFRRPGGTAGQRPDFRWPGRAQG
jgi:hypothetical protein